MIFLFVARSGLNQLNFVCCESTLEKLKNITEILNPYPQWNMANITSDIHRKNGKQRFLNGANF
jgi:hypothetical protein